MCHGAVPGDIASGGAGQDVRGQHRFSNPLVVGIHRLKSMRQYAKYPARTRTSKYPLYAVGARSLALE